jgi:hypothetical protein
MFMPAPLDDAMVVSLKEPDAKDTQRKSSLRLSQATPAYGSTSGGETVTLSGWGFRPGASVYFGDTKEPPVTYVSATTLQVMTPRSAVSGPVPIKVVNPDGTEVAATDAFRFAFDTLSFNPSLFTISDVMTDFTFVHLDKASDDQPDIVYTRRRASFPSGT